MKLKSEIENIRDLRKNTRVIIEKMKDLTFQRKFENVISKNIIANRFGQTTDIQLCILCIIESYDCYLMMQFGSAEHPKKKYQSLLKNLSILGNQVQNSRDYTKPVQKRYVSNVLRAHTKYFNSIELKNYNKNCQDTYERLVLSAICVWNNNWS